MVRDESTSALLAAFLTRTHKAVTIAKRVEIGSFVVDACVIEATKEAAAWYGLKDPKLLIGRWLSLLHHPDDAQLGRDLSVAWHSGFEVPTRYVSRICQVQAPGTFRSVLKDTTRLTLGGETYWITILSEPTGPPLALHMDVFEHFRLPRGETSTHFCGLMSVAQMEAILQRSGLAMTALSQISKNSLSQKSDNTQTPAVAGLAPRPAPALAPGRTYLMPTGRYVHWCTVCGNLWRSAEAQPLQCGHRSCHSPYWRTGKPLEAEDDFEKPRRK